MTDKQFEIIVSLLKENRDNLKYIESNTDDISSVGSSVDEVVQQLKESKED